MSHMNFHSILRLLIAFAIALLATRHVDAQQGYLDYDSATGSFSLDVVSTTNGFTTFELTSRTGQFLVDAKPESLFNGPWDVFHPNKLFQLDQRSFFDLEFGPILTMNLPVPDLAYDLCVSGSLLSGGAVDNILLRSGGETYSLCELNSNPLPTPEQFIPPPPPKPTGPAQPFFFDYVPDTGHLTLNSPESIMTLIEVVTRDVEFAYIDVTQDLVGPFDVFAATKFFRMEPRGFQTTVFGVAIAVGTPAATLAADLCYTGVLIQGGNAGELFVRSEGSVHPVTCGAPPEKFNVATAVELNPSVDIGVVFEPNGGNLIVHVPEDPIAASKPLVQIEVSATKNVFVPNNKLVGVLDGPSDILTESRLVKVDDGGFGTIDFGPILRNGEALGVDLGSVLTVTATFAGGEAVDSVQFVNLSVVPETSPGILLLLAIPLFAKRRRYP